MATGCLSTARVPDFEGLASFKGKTYHTGHWPHEGVDFTGQRVGVIGTGSSAIQAIPVIAEQAAHLTVFQRTPNFSIPSRNGPMTPDYEQAWKAAYPQRRDQAREARTGILNDPNDKSALEVSDEERQREYEARWAAGGTSFMAAFNDLIFSQPANDTAAEFVRNKIRGIVRDPAVAELLAPKNHPIGTKRICVDTDYYETYNRDERHAGRCQERADHRDHADRPARRRTRVRTRQHRVRHRLRRDDRRADQRSTSAAGTVSRCATSGKPGRGPISA